jgi:hypothetical protein
MFKCIFNIIKKSLILVKIIYYVTNEAYLAIIKILQDNAKMEEVNVPMVKDIYDMVKTTLSSETDVDEMNLKQKILKGMEK